MRTTQDSNRYVQEIQTGNHTDCDVEPGASKAQVRASTVTHVGGLFVYLSILALLLAHMRYPAINWNR